MKPSDPFANLISNLVQRGVLKVLVRPVVELIVMISVLILSARFGLSYLAGHQSVLNEAQKNEKILLQKRDILTSVGSDVLSQTSLAAVALPDKNPALAVLFQIRQIASENSIAVSGFTMGEEGQDTGNLSTIDLAFVADGAIGPLINFAKAVQNILPLSEIVSVKVEIEGTAAKAAIELKSFWSPFPKSITSFGEKLIDLTDEDKAVLLKLSVYKFPSIVTPQPNLPSPNTNPFGE